jgi:hypothetical protein
MISKIDTKTIEPTKENVAHLVDKYNLLVELYAMSVSYSLKYEELYEINFDERAEMKRQNMLLSIQLSKLTEGII